MINGLFCAILLVEFALHSTTDGGVSWPLNGYGSLQIHDMLDFAYAALDSWPPLAAPDMIHQSQMSELAYSFPEHRDFTRIVEPVDDFFSSPAASRKGAGTAVEDAAELRRALSAMPREQREMLVAPRSTLYLFCPELFASEEDGQHGAFVEALRPHIAQIEHQFSPITRRVGLSAGQCAASQPSSGHMFFLVVGSLSTAVDLTPLTLECLSDISCDGFYVHMRDSEKDIINRDTLLRSTSASAVGAYVPFLKGSLEKHHPSSAAFLFLLHRVAGKAPMVFHAAAIQVLSGPQHWLRSSSLSQGVPHDYHRGHDVFLPAYVSVRIVDRWFDPISTSGGLRAQFFESGSSYPNAACDVDLLVDEREATVSAGSAIVSLGRVSVRHACQYRLDLFFAPLPVLSRTQYGAEQLRRSAGPQVAREKLFLSMLLHSSLPSTGVIDESSLKSDTNVFVIFSVVALNASHVCHHVSRQSSLTWKQHAQNLWNRARLEQQRLGKKPLPPAVVAVSVAVSEIVFKTCPLVFASSDNYTSGVWDPAVGVRVVSLENDDLPPPAVVIHSQEIAMFSTRFQRVADYYSFYGEDFFCVDEEDPSPAISFVSALLAPMVEPSAAALLDEMQRNVWLAAVLRGPGVLQNEPTFPLAPVDIMHRFFSNVGPVLSNRRTWMVVKRVQSVFVGSVRDAFSAAAARAPVKEISMRLFPQILFAIVANDECHADSPSPMNHFRHTRPVNIDCALLL
jgi:hypothetical protein